MYTQTQRSTSPSDFYQNRAPPVIPTLSSLSALDLEIASVRKQKQRFDSRPSLTFIFDVSIPKKGQKYALFELKVVLSWVLRKFEFSIADPSGPSIQASSEIVLKPLDGIHLVVKPRQSRSMAAWKFFCRALIKTISTRYNFHHKMERMPLYRRLIQEIPHIHFNKVY